MGVTYTLNCEDGSSGYNVAERVWNTYFLLPNAVCMCMRDRILIYPAAIAKAQW